VTTVRARIVTLLWPILLPLIAAAVFPLVLFLPHAAQALIYGSFRRSHSQSLHSVLQ